MQGQTNVARRRAVAGDTGRRAAGLVMIGVWLACTPVVLGQSNSLRKRAAQVRQQRAPASQPASYGRVRRLVPVASPRRSGAPSAAPTPNPALLRASLIAVEPPQPRKLKVHDLVTIIVREDRRSISDAKLKSEKKWTIDAELRDWIRFHDHKLIPQNFPVGNPAIGFDLDSKYDGKGKNDRKDSLTTRVTAEIIDVKPNGTLVLEAKKTIEMDADVQIVTLTGVCRSEDVTAQNTVLSTQLASAHISVKDTGPARDATRRGWLMRAFDLLRPF